MRDDSHTILAYTRAGLQFPGRSWAWLAASLIPASAVATYNAYSGERFGVMIGRVSAPLQSVLSRGFADSVAAVLCTCVPVSLGLVLAWIAWRGFREKASMVARIGRFVAWMVIVLHVGVLLCAVGGVVLALAIRR